MNGDGFEDTDVLGREGVGLGERVGFGQGDGLGKGCGFGGGDWLMREIGWGRRW